MLCLKSSAREICFCGKGGSWWQGPSFMSFNRLETGIALLSGADPWRGAYRSPQSDRCVWKKLNKRFIRFWRSLHLSWPDSVDTQGCESFQSSRACAGPQRCEDGHLERSLCSIRREGEWKSWRGKGCGYGHPVRESIQGSFWIHKVHQSRRSHLWQPSLRKCRSASPL